MIHWDQCSVDFCPSARRKLYKDGYPPRRPASIFSNCQIIQRKQPWKKNFVSPFQWIPVLSFLRKFWFTQTCYPYRKLVETSWNRFEPLDTYPVIFPTVINSIFIKVIRVSKRYKNFRLTLLTVKQFKMYLDVVIRFPSFNWIECEWQIWSQVSPLPGRPITNRRWHFWRTAWTLRPVRLWTGTFTNN